MSYLNTVSKINKIPKLFKISINTNFKLFNILLKIKSEINKFLNYSKS